jgi:methylmalonyl-CoA/ethylmalonyl-CoA epimerase
VVDGGLHHELLPRVDQVAFVVRDLDLAAREYHERLGIGPWRIYHQASEDVRDKTYRGQAGDFGVRYALAQAGNLWFELVEPTHGRSVHSEWLERRGPGLHHLGLFVDDLNRSLAAYAERGYEMVQSGCCYGLDGDGRYAYLDTTAVLSVYLELIERPARRRAADYTVPAEVEGPNTGGS